MSKTIRLSTPQTIEKIIQKCKDKSFVDTQIATFQEGATNAIKSILEMSKSVSVMHQKLKNREINTFDLNYFCMKVNLKRNGSQYRKFICIGNHAEQFNTYIEKLPQTISVLYEITTLSAETFEELFQNDYIKPNLTLGQLKKLAFKPVVHKSNKRSTDSLAVVFDFDNISEKSKKLLFKFYIQMKKCSDISINLPNDDALSYYLENHNEDDEVIDASFRTIESYEVAA
jgi:hypothetical protein